MQVSLQAVKGASYLDYSGVMARSSTLVAYAACLALLAVALIMVLGYALILIRSYNPKPLHQDWQIRWVTKKHGNKYGTIRSNTV